MSARKRKAWSVIDETNAMRPIDQTIRETDEPSENSIPWSQVGALSPKKPTNSFLYFPLASNLPQTFGNKGFNLYIICTLYANTRFPISVNWPLGECQVALVASCEQTSSFFGELKLVCIIVYELTVALREGERVDRVNSHQAANLSIDSNSRGGGGGSEVALPSFPVQKSLSKVDGGGGWVAQFTCNLSKLLSCSFFEFPLSLKIAWIETFDGRRQTLSKVQFVSSHQLSLVRVNCER